MKVYITQDDCGMVKLFNKKPERIYIPEFKSNKWVCPSNGCIAIELNNDSNEERILLEDGNVHKISIADLIGLKRKNDKNGILGYVGISTWKPRVCEMTINLKMLNDYGEEYKCR